MAALGWLLNLDFAAGGTVTPPATPATTGGGWAQPSYVKGKGHKRKKDFIREELDALTSEVKALPPEVQATIKAQVAAVEARIETAEAIEDQRARLRAINLLMAEATRLRRDLRRIREERLILHAVTTFWYH